MARQRRVGSRHHARHLAVVGLIALLFTAASPRATATLPQPTWLDLVNHYRVESGLDPVTENPSWDAGIAAHLQYLRFSPPEYATGQYASAHTENPASPAYTADGDAAARASNLTYEQPSVVAAVDSWMTAPFHAIGMLRPGLRDSAFAIDSAGNAGMDVGRGVDPNVAARTVLFPGEGSLVHLRAYTGERPDPLESCPGYTAPAGLPLIAILPASPVGPVTAQLVTPDGRTLGSGSDLCVITADTYRSADPVYGPVGEAILRAANAVLIVPRSPLTTGSYTATIDDSTGTTLNWSFDVGRPREQAERDGVDAIAAADPADLSAAISVDEFADHSVHDILVATSARFPDLLAAGPLAGMLRAPIFLTSGDPDSGDYLSDSVTSEIERVSNGQVVIHIAGGEAAVSHSVEDQLRSLPGVASVDRIAGATRVETAVAIADIISTRSPATQVMLARATGGNAPFADALTGSAYGAATGVPVLLTDSDHLSQPTEVWLNQHRRSVLLLGGTAAISDDVEAAAANAATQVTRIAGVDRYETAVAIATDSSMWNRPSACDGGASRFTIANGNEFAAAALAADYADPVLLTDGEESQTAASYLQRATCEPSIVVLSAGDVDASSIAQSLGSQLARGAAL